jgi:hypothetical protein
MVTYRNAYERIEQAMLAATTASIKSTSHRDQKRFADLSDIFKAELNELTAKALEHSSSDYVPQTAAMLWGKTKLDEIKKELEDWARISDAAAKIVEAIMRVLTLL